METQAKEKQNFAELWERYDKELSKGDRAELRRVKEPDELRDISALYRLIGTRPDSRLLRIVYCFPYADHEESAESLGVQLAKAKNINEMRLFQIVRSEEPNDLKQLRRILQQVEPKVNWKKFGDTLFYWGEKSKRSLIEDFFVEKYAEKGKKKKEKDHE